MQKSLFISLVALVVSVVALFFGYNQKNNSTENNTTLSINSSDEFSANVQKALVENPEMIVEAMQKYQEKMQEKALADAKKMIQDHIEKINNDPTSPFVGPEDAEIVLVEFYDYACGYCHRLAPELNKVIDANAKVKFVFKPLAFLSQGSKVAQKAVLAAHMQGKFTELHNAIFNLKASLSEENIIKIAEKEGLDVEKLKADMESSQVREAIENIESLAGDIQINGVPTLVLNGEMLQTIDREVIQSSIDELTK